jgi:ribosomal protein S18 acetylase RimI-like enzyme
MSAEVRLADARDAEAVARLMVAFRDHLGHDWPSDNSFLASVERLLDERDTEFLLGFADPDGPPAGVVQLRYRWGIWRAGTDCLVEDVFVLDTARGAGLGRAMVEFAIARARERGCRRMELDTNENNSAAIGLYEGLGFTNRSSFFEDGRDLYYRLHLEDED